MTAPQKFFITTAIDYPNSRPHIGTAFEKIGADVQARYRRMEGYAVHFLMGNDENTIKVARRAAELGQEPKPYCDDMARQFQEVWKALDISNDDFIQTSEPRHHQACQKFIQKVFDNGWIYKGTYDGWYCEGCEGFKTDTEVKDAGGVCPDHKVPPVRRTEPCYFFALSKFQERLLKFYEEHPDFIQPESRRNEILSLVKVELKDVNISRFGQKWGIPIPFDPDFTIYVWFDALINYIAAIGYGVNEEQFARWWPADIHVIGKDITRFHCALWPAMCFAAEIEPPHKVFGHGFVYIKGEKISKTLGNAIEPMDIITKFGSDAFRYYFMRECPFSGDGDFSWQRFQDLCNADLANNIGNLFSRAATLISKNYAACLDGVGGKPAPQIIPLEEVGATIEAIRGHVEVCQYNQALDLLIRNIATPANKYFEDNAPWKLVKVDKDKTKEILWAGVELLRKIAILLKPFLPKLAQTIYSSFNFHQPWDEVRYADAYAAPVYVEDLRIVAPLVEGKVKPLFPRIG
jgi:methionyl-tRNA synthetase